jgi:hypothetical protein
MKNWFNKIWLLPVLALAVFACDKDEEKTILAITTGPSLGLSATTLTLTEANAKNTALTVTASAADYGFAAASTHRLQFDRRGNNFAAPQEINMPTLSRSFTTAELNDIAIKLGVAPGTATDLDVRIKSDLLKAPTVFSNVVGLRVTPYLVIIVYPTLYVPGSYQGWAPDKADRIVSVKSNDNYEGFVNFPDATTEFKLTSAANWNSSVFGDEGDGSSGKIASPGSNFKANSSGYYRINADLSAKVWSLTKTSWGVIGDATPGGWGSDTDMRYDPASKSWKATIALTQAEIKFRANDDWGINFGDTGANASLEYGGDNIKVPAAGTYDIELILSIPGNYTYKLTRK